MTGAPCPADSIRQGSARKPCRRCPARLRPETLQTASGKALSGNERERIDFFQSIRSLKTLRPMDHTSFIQFFLLPFHPLCCPLCFVPCVLWRCNPFPFSNPSLFCVPAHSVCLEPCCLFTLMEDVVLSLCYEFIIMRPLIFVNTFLLFFFYFFNIFSGRYCFRNLSSFLFILHNLCLFLCFYCTIFVFLMN